MNGIEEKLIEIWKNLFEMESFGIDDNFFELSGDSILHTRFIANVQDEYNIDITYDDYVSHDSICKMAAFIYDKGGRL